MAYRVIAEMFCEVIALGFCTWTIGAGDTAE